MGSGRTRGNREPARVKRTFPSFGPRSPCDPIEELRDAGVANPEEMAGLREAWDRWCALLGAVDRDMALGDLAVETRSARTDVAPPEAGGRRGPHRETGGAGAVRCAAVRAAIALATVAGLWLATVWVGPSTEVPDTVGRLAGPFDRPSGSEPRRASPKAGGHGGRRTVHPPGPGGRETRAASAARQRVPDGGDVPWEDELENRLRAAMRVAAGLNQPPADDIRRIEQIGFGLWALHRDAEGNGL